MGSCSAEACRLPETGTHAFGQLQPVSADIGQLRADFDPIRPSSAKFGLCSGRGRTPASLRFFLYHLRGTGGKCCSCSGGVAFACRCCGSLLASSEAFTPARAALAEFLTLLDLSGARSRPLPVAPLYIVRLGRCGTFGGGEGLFQDPTSGFARVCEVLPSKVALGCRSCQPVLVALQGAKC